MRRSACDEAQHRARLVVQQDPACAVLVLRAGKFPVTIKITQSPSPGSRACALADSGRDRRGEQHTRGTLRAMSHGKLACTHMWGHICYPCVCSGAWAADASCACSVSSVMEREGHNAQCHLPCLCTITCSPSQGKNIHCYSAPTYYATWDLCLQQRRAAVPC